MLSSKTTLVASIQYAPELLNIEKNLNVALQMTFEAAAKGAKIIVLPELCLSGYALNNSQEASKCSQEKNGYQTLAFAKIASNFNCYIVFGYVELSESKLYNSAAIIGPQGFLANCQKHNLWGPDALWAQSAESMCPVVATPYGRLGALICRDNINNYRKTYKFYKKEHQFYKKGSVDTIALLTNWGESYGYPDNSWIELSEETNANIIVSNRVGKERDLSFKGGSCCIDKNLHVWTNGSSFTDDAVVGGFIIV